MTPISAHFSLEECTHSQTADRLNINNDLPMELMQNVKKAALGMELVRMELNSNAILVSSWYRCLALNTAVGSKPTSAHTTGFAIDFTCPSFGDVDTIIKKIIKSNVPYQQIIKEFVKPDGTGGWCHISFNGEAKEALVIDHDGTRIFS